MIAAFYSVIRPLLFALDPERAHRLALRCVSAAPGALGAVARRALGPIPAGLARTLGPLRLAGPIGLAAGLDKEGEAIRFWPALGFGFIEVGTVTAHPQPGNPRPRLFRLPGEHGLINRFGFNNSGSAELARRLAALKRKSQWPAIPVGVNLGKSKVTPIEDAVRDYVTSIERLSGVADYFVLNVSSPNTPGLRDLQAREALEELLPAAVAAAGSTPVMLKLAPDLAGEDLDVAIELAIAHRLLAVIATNTTVRRDLLLRDPGHAGGLSGRPLWPLARITVERALRCSAGRIPVIGVGGIETAAQVRELLALGCVAVQLYSALVYRGPGLVAKINRALG